MNAQAELDESVRRHDMFLSARLGGQRALLANRDLSGLNLADKRLNDADLTAAFLPAARMAGANLAKSTLFTLQPDAGGFARSSADARRSARRGAARANREGADLFDADLREGRLGQRLCMGVIEEVAVEHAPPQTSRARAWSMPIRRKPSSPARSQRIPISPMR